MSNIVDPKLRNWFDHVEFMEMKPLTKECDFHIRREEE